MFPRLYHARALAGLWCVLLCPRVTGQVLHQPHPPRSGIRSVIFERTPGLSADTEQRITLALQQEDSSWVVRQKLDVLSRFVKNMVLSAYQDCGYWRAKVLVEVTWAHGSADTRQVDVLVRTAGEGPQYTLKEIRFTGASVFSSAELVERMPIHPENLMDRGKVEQGLEAIRELYASRGYIAFAAVPHAELDDVAHTVTLNIAVQEDQPFYFGNLMLEGVDSAAGRRLRNAWDDLRSQPYSQEKLRAVLKESLPLPTDADPFDYSTRSVDFDTHTVDVQISLPLETQAAKAGR